MEENWLNPQYAEYYNKNYATSAEEFAAYLDILEVNAEDSLIDFGCGDGAFLELAAAKAQKVYGLDISELQTQTAARRLKNRANSEIILSPFVEFLPEGRHFTKAFSRKALHHLTDEEKQRFLLNIAPAFVKGAKFFIEDGIFFNFAGREQIEENWTQLLKEAADYYGAAWEAKSHDIINSFRCEFPTGAAYWEKCFNEAGFTVVAKQPKCSFYGSIMAVKR